MTKDLGSVIGESMDQKELERLINEVRLGLGLGFASLFVRAATVSVVSRCCYHCVLQLLAA